MELNPPGQYADDRHLHARQRLWQGEVPFFDIAAWVLDLARPLPGAAVLDVGCGNGIYLRALRERRINAVGCDLSLGMLASTAHPALINADVTALPVRELSRVLVPGGPCVAVTTGPQHLRSLRDLIERAVRPGTPDWSMGAPTGSAFTLGNAVAQLGVAFPEVACARPPRAGPVIITEAAMAADYVSSLAPTAPSEPPSACGPPPRYRPGAPERRSGGPTSTG